MALGSRPQRAIRKPIPSATAARDAIRRSVDPAEPQPTSPLWLRPGIPVSGVPLSDCCLLQTAMAPGAVVIAIALDAQRQGQMTQVAEQPPASLNHRLRSLPKTSDGCRAQPLTLVMGMPALLRSDATRAVLGESPPDIIVDTALFHGRHGARLRGKKAILAHLQGLYPRARVTPLRALIEGAESVGLRRLAAEHGSLRIDEFARQHFELRAIERSDGEPDQLAHWLIGRGDGIGVVFTRHDFESRRLLETLRRLGLTVAEPRPSVHLATDSDGLDVFVLPSGRHLNAPHGEISFVVHTHAPASLGVYRAELESVGCSSRRVNAAMFYSIADLTRHSLDEPVAGGATSPDEELIEYCVRTRVCRHRMLLRQRHPQFPPPSPADDPCDHCDNCRRQCHG